MLPDESVAAGVRAAATITISSGLLIEFIGVHAPSLAADGMGRPASCGLGGTRTDISGRTRAWPGGGGRGWRAGRGGDTLASGKVVQLRKKPVTVGIPVARPSVRTRACAANADGSYLWFWRQNTHWCTVAGFGPLATGPRVVQKIVFTSTGFFDSAVVAASPAFIRLPHRYYVVRLPASVHMGLTLFAFSHQTVAVRQRMLNNGASRFSCVRFLYMHGVCASEEPAAHSRFPRAAVLMTLSFTVSRSTLFAASFRVSIFQRNTSERPPGASY